MEKPAQNGGIGAVILAATAIVMFSSKAILVKKAYMYDIDSVSLLLIRMAFALPVYVIIALITTWKHRNSVRLTLSQLITVILLGFAGYYLASFLDFQGLNYISASLERLILFVYPTMVVVISAVYYRQKIPQIQLIAILITYFGVFIIFFRNVEFAGEVNAYKGVLFIIASAFTYACYLVGSGGIIPKLGSVRFTSYAMIVACMGVGVHYLLSGSVTILNQPREIYQIGALMAVICTILPSFMISEAIRRLGASKVAILGSIGPISTIILAYIFLGERIGPFQWLGALIVISGVMLVNREKIKMKAVTGKSY